MKKFLSLILAVVMVATVFTACGSSENKTGDKKDSGTDGKIGIVALLENGAFMDMK